MPAVQPRITVSMNDDTYAYIKYQAERSGVSMSAYCNILIRKQIDQETEVDKALQRIAELDSEVNYPTSR